MPGRHQPAAAGPAAPAQPGAAGLVRLLPARRVQRHLPVPGHYTWDRVMNGSGGNTAGSHGSNSAAATAPADGGPTTRRTSTVRPRQGSHHALPLPGREPSPPLAGHGMSTHQHPHRDLRRARCQNGHAGFGRAAPGKPTGSNAGRAPRADLNIDRRQDSQRGAPLPRRLQRATRGHRRPAHRRRDAVSAPGGRTLQSPPAVGGAGGWLAAGLGAAGQAAVAGRAGLPTVLRWRSAWA